MPAKIPAFAWKRRFDEQLPAKPSSMKVTPALILNMLPTLMRLTSEVKANQKRGIDTMFDPLKGMLPVEPVHGVPLGGLGGGSITRGWKGDFNRWQMRPGLYRYGSVAADQFSLWVNRPGDVPHTLVLQPHAPEGTTLTAWNWGLKESSAAYHALYPRAWTTYKSPAPGIQLTCRQVSPVIPRNYNDSSYPAGVFVWTVENTGKTDADVALMFTFQNGYGAENDAAGGHFNAVERFDQPDGRVTAVTLNHTHRQPRPLEKGQKLADQRKYEDKLAFALAVQEAQGVQASYRARFVTNSHGLDIWGDFSDDGRLENEDNRKPSEPGMTIGAALAAKVTVPAGGTKEITFALAWDMPLARFASGEGWWRRYTKFYGRDGNAAAQIARDALVNFPAWERQIEAWQQPVLDDPDLPDWYKGMLFNESYFLTDGGTIWTAGREIPKEDGDGPLPEPEIGHFAYLESHEYRFFNTYDVHFYASWALAMLFPELELSLQRDFAHSVAFEDHTPVTGWASGKKFPRKLKGCLPHDLGDPYLPWDSVNAYHFQNVSRWKDLNSKFVLQIYRDFVLTGDRQFLSDTWEAVQQAVGYLQQFDADHDGMIENQGFPDQTYDTWEAKGISAYSGGLWLACLGAAGAMAEELGDPAAAQRYRDQLARAQKAYEQLWNGSYYDYDTSTSRHHDSIMADMLCGEWYAHASGLPGVVPAEHALKSLQTIYEHNVQGYFGGECGAVNGARPTGGPDLTNLQSKEMWAGTTFGLAAEMIQQGLYREAFETAHGVYLSVYRDLGLWFQTPEAIDVDDVVRAVGYMRPLAIWAMQYAWEKRSWLAE